MREQNTKIEAKDHIQSIDIVWNTSKKNIATKRLNMHTKIELKKEEGMVLTHAYQQGRFTSNKKMSSCSIREKKIKNKQC